MPKTDPKIFLNSLCIAMLSRNTKVYVLWFCKIIFSSTLSVFLALKTQNVTLIRKLAYPVIETVFFRPDSYVIINISTLNSSSGIGNWHHILPLKITFLAHWYGFLKTKKKNILKRWFCRNINFVLWRKKIQSRKFIA